MKLCIEYYNNALKIFEDAKYYEDAYVVCLNIMQTYLSPAGILQCSSIL